MAQSRLEKIGTIYSRTSSLLNSGAVKHKPIWYDVYEAFPPKYEPRWDRSPPLSKVNSKRKVLYEEDIIRARFYDHFQENIHETINLHDPESKCISQLFIEAYNATCVDIDDKSRFLAAVDTLELEKNINLRETASVSYDRGTEAPSEKPHISMKDLFLQNKGLDKET